MKSFWMQSSWKALKNQYETQDLRFRLGPTRNKF